MTEAHTKLNDLSILQFQDMFAGARSMAIVGNSSSVEAYDNGDFIDSHDIVVRFNRATPETMAGSVGQRTDIVVANEANSLRKAPSPAELTGPKCVVTFIKTPSLRGDTKWQQPFFEWVDETPLFLTTGPEILCCDVPRRRRGFSMGTYAIASLPYWLSIDRLFVTGFTMFGAVGGGAHHYCKEPSRVSVTWHDADIESQILAHVLGSLPCELVVTDEVARLMENQGIAAATLGATSRAAHAKQGPLRFMWYLMERFSKLTLTAGYSMRRVSERRRLATR